MSDGAIMEPVEVKIKTLPRKVANFGNLNKPEETQSSVNTSQVIQNKECTSSVNSVNSVGSVSGSSVDNKCVIFTAEPAIVVESEDCNTGK